MKSTRSRSSTGAVRWLSPTARSRMSEVVTLGQEIPDRSPGSTARSRTPPLTTTRRGGRSSPLDARTPRTNTRPTTPARRESSDPPTDIAWARGSVDCVDLRCPDAADADAQRQTDPADGHDPAVHDVERLQRRQPGVEEPEVLGLDLLEEQHVGDAEHAARARSSRTRRASTTTWSVKSGLRSSGGRGLTLGSSAGIRYERDHQDGHEQAHRALFGRQLDVEIRRGRAARRTPTAPPSSRRAGRGRPGRSACR